MKNLKTKELSLEELDDVSGGVNESTTENATVEDGKNLTIDSEGDTKKNKLIGRPDTPRSW
jgi:hypothetical protein